MRLSKADWNTLDELFGKMGFGGYYDLIEVLKDVIGKFSPSLKDAIENEKDLYTLIMVLCNIKKSEARLFCDFCDRNMTDDRVQETFFNKKTGEIVRTLCAFCKLESLAGIKLELTERAQRERPSKQEGSG